jgi:hypothetical protein
MPHSHIRLFVIRIIVAAALFLSLTSLILAILSLTAGRSSNFLIDYSIITVYLLSKSESTTTYLHNSSNLFFIMVASSTSTVTEIPAARNYRTVCISCIRCITLHPAKSMERHR